MAKLLYIVCNKDGKQKMLDLGLEEDDDAIIIAKEMIKRQEFDEVIITDGPGITIYTQKEIEEKIPKNPLE